MQVAIYKLVKHIFLFKWYVNKISIVFEFISVLLGSPLKER